MYRTQILNIFTRMYLRETPDRSDILEVSIYTMEYFSTNRNAPVFKFFKAYRTAIGLPLLLQKKKITPWQAICRLEQHGNKLKPYWR